MLLQCISEDSLDNKSPWYCLPLWYNAYCVGVNQSNTLHHVFTPRLCHRGQTHRFRHCSSATVGAFEYPKKNSRNGSKEELYFTWNSCTVSSNLGRIQHLFSNLHQSQFTSFCYTLSLHHCCVVWGIYGTEVLPIKKTRTVVKMRISAV